ncbi:hypothetical protein B7494_g541 [Chlorociboria aeruginascens]|nr:hypothetical protein B7494_g541 [Chlorociboria aeruginascens]
MSQNQQQPTSNNSFSGFRAAFSKAFQSTMPLPRFHSQGTAADPHVLGDSDEDETPRRVLSDTDSEIQILNSPPQINQTTTASTSSLLQQPANSSPHSVSDTRQKSGRHSLGAATAINRSPSLASRSPSTPESRASSSKIVNSTPGPKRNSGLQVSSLRAGSSASGSSTAPPQDAESSGAITPRPSFSGPSLLGDSITSRSRPSRQLQHLNSNQGSPVSQMKLSPLSTETAPTSMSLRARRQSQVSSLVEEVDALPYPRQGPARLLKQNLLRAIKMSINDGTYKLPKGETATGKAELLAIEVEDSLLKLYPRGEYRKRLSGLLRIIQTNQDVCGELFSQTISPLRLATMSVDMIRSQPSTMLDAEALTQEASNEDIEMEDDDSRTANRPSRTRSCRRRTIVESDIEMENDNSIADVIALVDKVTANQEMADEDTTSSLHSYAMSETPSKSSSRNKNKSQKSTDTSQEPTHTIGSSPPLIMRLREKSGARRRDASPREVMAERSASREGESDGNSEAIFQYEESFRRLKQTIFDDHALAVRWLLFDARQPCETTGTDFVDETSPFESMGAVKSSAEGLASGSYSTLEMVSYTYKKKMVKSRSQLIAHHITSNTPRIPRYNAHTNVQRNILSGDTSKLKFMPFLGDTWNKGKDTLDLKKEAGRKKMEKELKEAYQDGVPGSWRSRRQSEKLWQIRQYLDDWVKDMNISGGIDSLTQYAFDEAGKELRLGSTTRKLITKSFGGPLSPELIQSLERVFVAFQDVFKVSLRDVMLPRERIKEMAEKANSTNRGTPIKPAAALQEDSRLGTYTTLTCLICGLACCQTHGEYNEHDISNNQAHSDEEINEQENTEYMHEMVTMNYDDLLRKHDSRQNRSDSGNEMDVRRFSRPCSKGCHLLEGGLHEEYEWTQEDLVSLRSMLITLKRNRRLPCDLAFVLSRPCWQVHLEMDKVEPRAAEIPLIGRNKRPEWYDNKRKVLKNDWQEMTSAALHQERSQSNPVISWQEADRRGIVYDRRFLSFLFDLNADWCIDAARFGNKTRFINHASSEADGRNLLPKIVLVNGEHRIKFVALRDIALGEELFFDYGKNFAEKQGLNKKLPKSILGGKKAVIESEEASSALNGLDGGNRVRRARRGRGKASASRDIPTIPTIPARRGRGKARKTAPEKEPVIEMDEMAVDEYIDDEEEVLHDDDEDEDEDEDIGEASQEHIAKRGSDNSNVSSPNILSQNLQFSRMKRKTTTTLRIAIIVFLAIALCTFYHDGLPSLYAIRPFNYLFKNFKQIDDKDILENLSLTDDQCRYYFPGLMKEIDNAVGRGPFDLKRAPDEYTGQRIHALLNQLNRALITTSVASSIPDTILTLTVHDTPRNNSISYSLPFPPLPNSNYWVMPHFSFWSWPLPFIGPLPLALQSISSIEASTPWESKIDKAIWRGTAYYNGLVNTNLRPKLIEVTKDKEWADVQNLKWGTNGETAKNAIAIEDFWSHLFRPPPLPSSLCLSATHPTTDIPHAHNSSHPPPILVIYLFI